MRAVHAFKESSTDPEAIRSIFFVELVAVVPPPEAEPVPDEPIVPSLAQPPAIRLTKATTPKACIDRILMTQVLPTR
jgi:hypothetical protein